MKSWKDSLPERFEYELEQFRDSGLDFEVDPSLLEKQGRVVLRGSIEYQGESVELEVWYPDLFPYLRPEVVAPTLNLGRHQNPYQRNLCLLDRSTRDWSPADTGAWLVRERVPYLLSLLQEGHEALNDAESPQGEPISTYFPSLPGSAIFIPEEALHLPHEAKIGSGRISIPMEQGPHQIVRGLLSEVVEKKRKKTRTLASADRQLLEKFGGQTITIRWARLEEAPTENTPAAVFAAIDQIQEGFGSPPWEEVPGAQIAVAGAVFVEEVTQGTFEDTWVFAVRVRTEHREGEYMIRGERLSRNDLEARLPENVRLEGKTVALLGLGALGAALGFELSRGGLGRLRGMDYDIVEAGTTVRWARGLSAVGHLKTEYLRQVTKLDYPFTEFEPFRHQLGESSHVMTARNETELEVIERFLDGADLLVDASAEIGLQHLFSDQASARGIPQIFVSSTEGALGGMVARINPDRDGCWLCLQHHLNDGTISAPPFSAAGTLQPRGCATRTFVGAGHDLLPVIAQAARVSTAMLDDSIEIGRSTVDVCSLANGSFAPPSWETHRIEIHPSCANCNGGSR